MTGNGLIFKILFLGDSATGKRSICDRIVTGEFQPGGRVTMVGNISTIKYEGNDQEHPIKLILWTPPTGFGPFGRYAQALRGIRGLVLVYDITREKTFENLPRWLDDTLEFSTCFPIAVVGNKADLRDSSTITIDSERGRIFAEQVSDELEVPTLFLETSAKTGHNIQRLFSEFAETVANHWRELKLPFRVTSKPRKLVMIDDGGELARLDQKRAHIEFEERERKKSQIERQQLQQVKEVLDLIETRNDEKELKIFRDWMNSRKKDEED